MVVIANPLVDCEYWGHIETVVLGGFLCVAKTS